MSVYDVVVVGSGPAGHAAAIQAAKAGRKTAVIEKLSAVGGTSVNTGTIPSKALREAVLCLTGIKEREINGVHYSWRDTLGVQELCLRTDQVVKNENRVIKDQFFRNGVELITGSAVFRDAHRLAVVQNDGERDIEAEWIVIAVGSKPAGTREVAVNGRNIIDSDGAYGLQGVPKTMTVVGGGVVDTEFVSIFAALGVEITVVDQREAVLEHLDREITEALLYNLRRRGVMFRLGEQVTDVVEEGNQVVAYTASNKRIQSDVLLHSIGRQGSTAGLGLEAIGVEPDDRGRIPVNESYQTAVPHIYAVGDVIGFPSLATTSMIQGRGAMMHALGLTRQNMISPLPYGMYSIPEVSMVGKTEEELTRSATPYEVGLARYNETARGQIIVDDVGTLKLLVHAETRRILGVHIIGEGATELIHIGQMMIALDGTLDFLADSPFNYPTLAECYRIAALDAFNKLGAARDVIRLAA